MAIVSFINSTSSNGTHINSSVQLLKQTSKLIYVFRYSRPITSLSDCRLKVTEEFIWLVPGLEKKIVQLKAAGVNTVKMIISPKFLGGHGEYASYVEGNMHNSFEQVPLWVRCTF